MQLRPLVLRVIAAALVLSGPLLGYEAATHAAPPPKGRHVYRLDYALTVTEPGKAATTSAYVLNIEEGSGGDLHAGANVPLVSGPSGHLSPRQDVGVKLRSNLTRAGGDLILHSDVELSGVEPGIPLENFDLPDPRPRTIHKISAGDDAVVTPGKSALVASVEEPTTHARYEVTVTATKLR